MQAEEWAELHAADLNHLEREFLKVSVSAREAEVYAERRQQRRRVVFLSTGLTVITILAIVAAVLGGIGSIPGAMIGGYLIGLLEILLVAFFPELAGYRDAYAFVILLFILLVKPTGIIGEEIKEKV